jgi:hypothetical protein
VSEADAVQASIWTSATGLVLLAVAAGWTFGLRRLGARWAPRWILGVAAAVFIVLEIMVWSGPRPNVGPMTMLWASIAMPLLVTATFTLLLLLALTLAVALAGVVRTARGRPAS